MSKPLAGVKVLDLTTFVAAPVCARLLADLGAEVIKVERPAGDGWREFGMSYNVRFNDEENPVFDIYNTGKKCIALNLKDNDAKEIFWKLLEQSDVFVTNTRPDALERLGFGYEAVKARCPRLIYAIVLGYGEKGPDTNLPAFDTSAFWSRSGFLRDQGTILPDGQYMPVTAPSSMGDTATGYMLLAQINAALYGRTVTGKGDYVRSGLFHNAIFITGTMQIYTQPPWGSKLFPPRRIDAGVPGGLYRCEDDEWIFIAVGYAPVYLPVMYKMIGRPELVDDERFKTQEGRNKYKQEIYTIFRDAFLTKPSAYWVEFAGELDLPLVRLNHYTDISTDEQAWANGYLEQMEFRSGLEGVMPRSPISMDSVGQLKTTCAPQIGADNDAVLGEMGYSPEEIQNMREAGAVGH